MKWVHGAALAVVLSGLFGCGGGSGSGFDGMGSSGGRYQNIAGVDPRDTWKSAYPVRSYFDLDETPGAEIKPGILGYASLDLQARLKDMTILGSKDGITYGHGMSGPTDTIDIDFTEYFSELPDHVQGALERAGKSWSYRLQDKLGSYESTDAVVTGVERIDGQDPPWHVDGVLIRIRSDLNTDVWDYEWYTSGAAYRYYQLEDEGFTMRTGTVDLAADSIYCCGADWLAYIASHEIGHILGHSAAASRLPETTARYVDFERAVWLGPALTAANGGRHVRFQERDGEPDFGHLGACAMIMSYCGDAIAIPHEMDFAFMKDIGYTVDEKYPTAPELSLIHI